MDDNKNPTDTTPPAVDPTASTPSDAPATEAAMPVTDDSGAAPAADPTATTPPAVDPTASDVSEIKLPGEASSDKPADPAAPAAPADDTDKPQV